MLTDEERKEVERSSQVNTAGAFMGLLLLVGSLGFMAFMAAQEISAGRSLFELSSAPLGYALFGLFFWWIAKRRLNELAEIRKRAEPNQSPEPMPLKRHGSS